MADSNERLPEEIDEQHQRLIGNLRLIYGADRQKAQQLTRIHQRLLEDEVSMRPLPGLDSQQRFRDGNAARPTRTEQKPWQRQVSMIAAVLVTALVVSSLLFVLNISHRKSIGGTLAKPTGGFNTLRSLHMIDASTGWILTGHAVLYTVDGGIHWKNVTPHGATLTQNSIADFRTAAIASIATPLPDGTSTQVLHSTDGGQIWQQATVQMPFVRDISFVDPLHGWLLAAVRPPDGAAEPVSVFHTTDGGKTWTNIAEALFADATPPGRLPYGGLKTGLRFLDSSTGWVTGTATLANLALLSITHDGGSTWQQQALPLPSGVPSARFMVLAPSFFSSANGILPVIFSDIATDRAIATAIYTTHDGGKTWQRTAPVSTALPLFSFADMQHGWATNGTVLYSTNNGGTSWQRLSPNASFKNIAALNFVSDTVGWAMSSTPSNFSSLLKTVDSGRTWTPTLSTIA